MKQPSRIYVWPASIDSTKTRKEGRRILKDACVESPRLSEIEEAAMRLGLKVIVASGAARPSSWWERTGYVMVSRNARSKASIMKEITKSISHLRRTKLAEGQAKG